MYERGINLKRKEIKDGENSTINIFANINQQIWKLWSNEFDHLSDSDLAHVLVPFLYDEAYHIIPDGIMFIGMNPGFNPARFKSVAVKELSDYVTKKDISYKDLDYKTYFEWENRKLFDPNVAINIDKVYSRVYNDYTAKFNEISKFIFGDANRWNNIDLFFMRRTNQKEVEHSLNHLGDNFIQRQLCLSLSLIKHFKPKIILIANAGAVKILQKHRFLTFPVDNCDYVSLNIEGLSQIPIFTSSMLSGQRALDLSSLHLLKRCMKRAITPSMLFSEQGKSYVESLDRISGLMKRAIPKSSKKDR